MQEVDRRPADPNQWATGTPGWGQKKSSDNDIDWNQEHHTAKKVLQSTSEKAEDASELGGASKSGSVIAYSGAANSCNQDKTQGSSKMASVSWGPSSSAVGLDSSLWGGLSATSSGNNSTWGSVMAPDNQGHKTQIGASSMADGQSSNGSASAGTWGISPTNQNGASLPGSLAQSQSNNLPGNSSGLNGSSNNPGMGSLGISAIPWQNKPFGMSDANGNNTSSSLIGSNSSNKEGISTKTNALTESGKMDLAAGLANLAIDKTAPPPDVNWKMKPGWTSSGAKQPVAGNPAELSFARATQKEKKPIIGGFKDGVLTAKEEEIRRAINSNEGWGTRPIRQDTPWDIESIAPKSSRKTSVETSEMAPSTIWNDKGTDIWEPSRVTPGSGWGGGAAGGGNVFADKTPNSWNIPPKPNMDVGDWGGGRTNNPVMNNPMSDKTIGTWGGENQQQSSSKLWGGATETGSWNEPPSEQSNRAWNGQDTDVGTWEDPAQQSANSRRIVSSSGIGPASLGVGGSGMNLSNNTGMGSGNMGIGSSNIGMGSSTMRMGSNNMGMGAGNGMMGNMNMPMAGSGGNMGMGNGGMAGNMGMGMAMGAANNINMMMGGMNNMTMNSGSSGNGSDPSLYWNDPNPKSQGWNPGTGPPHTKTEEPWNKSGMGNASGSSGWGEPINNAQKADDGTRIWFETAQEQTRSSGWGDSSAAWNPAYGARPKTSPWLNSGDQDNLQRRLGQRFSGSGGQPQMRIKLIQQLMDMGFKKEDAQNALISNNMNFESALGELTSVLHGKREMVNDVFLPGGEKIHHQGLMSDNAGMMYDDMSEHRADSNPHVPNFPMQNTPFSNAQVPNQSLMTTGLNMYDRSKVGPPMPPNSGGNMSNMQHKLKVLQQQQSGTTSVFNNLSPTQVRGGALPGNNTQSMVQQQAAQQQILQQLRLAVQSGLISPQLLNQQLPHNILVMLQQLLQLQNALQNLLQRQQFLQQNKVTLNIPRTQLDQVSGMINHYKSQIQALQKQLQAAQQSLLIKQQPPTVPTPSIQQMQSMMQQPPMGMPPSIATSLQGECGSETLMSLPGDVSISNGGINNVGMSRLNQWKQASIEQDGHFDLNRAPGTKPQGLHHSHSTPTVGPFGDLPSLNISGDTTWSSSATSGASNWPTTSGNSSSLDGKSEDGMMSTSGLASMLKENHNLGMSTDVIPEFVPGQPWQGLNSKSVEDDPHITPGSVSRSLSVNVVKDDYLNNLTGNNKSSSAELSLANAVTLGTASLQAQQAANSGHWQGNGDYNRQHSWAGRSIGSAFTQVSGSGWDSRQPPWMLKNVASQEEAQ